MRRLLLTLFGIWAGTFSAQTLDDVELFNVHQLQGSARFTAMGGAFNSLGNDFSAIHLNPAGAAVFRKSRVGGSLAIGALNADYSGHNDRLDNYSEFEFAIPNFGFVLKSNKRKSTGTSGWAFAVTVDKMADFDRFYQSTQAFPDGIDRGYTLAQYYLTDELYPDGTQGAQGYEPNDISDEAFAAYQAAVLLADNTDAIATYGFGASGGFSSRYQRDQRGNQSEIGLTLAGEKNDRLYYGVSLNFPTITYTQEDKISDYGLPTDTVPFDIREYRLDRYNSFQGGGVNLKLGVIARLNKWIRLGASYQTPTWYSVDQLYDVQITAQSVVEGQFQSELISTGNYTYSLRTPSIYRVGASFLLPSKRGLLSIDYEFRDPSNSQVSSGGANSISDNDAEISNLDIESVMSASNTLKAGLELKFGHFSLRGGANFVSSFYENADDFRSEQLTISGGVGYENSDWGVDLSVSNSSYQRQDYIHPYLDKSGRSLVENNFNLTLVTTGFHLKF